MKIQINSTMYPFTFLKAGTEIAFEFHEGGPTLTDLAAEFPMGRTTPITIYNDNDTVFAVYSNFEVFSISAYAESTRVELRLPEVIDQTEAQQLHDDINALSERIDSLPGGASSEVLDALLGLDEEVNA